jgi:NADH-quinone oxidoreductase subunit M
MSSLLILTIFLPMLGAVALLLMPRANYRQARLFALVISIATLAVAAFIGLHFQNGELRSQFAASSGGQAGMVWMHVPGGSGIRFAFGLDGISVGLYLMTTLLVITSIFSSWEPIKERAPAHYALILMLETGLLGLFASLDVILFYIFFEFTLIPLFFLIGVYGGSERRRASIVFFLYTLAGSLLTLLGVICLILVHQKFSPTHVLTFNMRELAHGLSTLPWDRWSAEATNSWTSPQVLIFLLLFAGFAVKVPMFPFHTWLPLAHVEAPTAGSILLAGVLLKVGIYGFIRFNLSMTPAAAVFLLPFLAALCVIGIIYGALTALAQTDAKKLVAYSSVSHMGFIALGLFSLTSTAIDGAVLHMINHGITTSALFACVGIFYERYHTREMSEVGGLWARLPILAFFFILSALGSAAVPGLNGFVGEFPILLGMFSRYPLWAILGAVGMVLGPYYLLHMLQRVVFGPLHEPGGHAEPHGPAHAETAHAPIRPIGWHEIAGLAPLMVLIVAIGVYPNPLFRSISPSVRELVARFPRPAETQSIEAPPAGTPMVATSRHDAQSVTVQDRVR